MTTLQLSTVLDDDLLQNVTERERSCRLVASEESYKERAGISMCFIRALLLSHPMCTTAGETKFPIRRTTSTALLQCRWHDNTTQRRTFEVAPLCEPTFSTAATTSSPSTTLPKTTCLPSSLKVTSGRSVGRGVRSRSAVIPKSLEMGCAQKRRAVQARGKNYL